MSAMTESDDDDDGSGVTLRCFRDRRKPAKASVSRSSEGGSFANGALLMSDERPAP